PAYDALRKHRIRFHTNAHGKWTMDDCPECGSKNSLSSYYDDDVAEWRCNNCGWSGSERLRPARAPTNGGGTSRADDDDDDYARKAPEARKEFDDIDDDPPPGATKGAVEGAPDGSYSHVWRSKNYDFPCTPTGEEQRGSDRRIYAWVKRDGGESCVPKDELI